MIPKGLTSLRHRQTGERLSYDDFYQIAVDQKIINSKTLLDAEAHRDSPFDYALFPLLELKMPLAFSEYWLDTSERP